MNKFLRRLKGKGKKHHHKDYITEEIVRSILIDMLLLIVLLICVYFVADSLRTKYMYYDYQQIEKYLLYDYPQEEIGYDHSFHISFDDISTISEIWEYILFVFIPKIFTNMSLQAAEGEEKIKYHLAFMTENIIVGLPRMRQIRVHSQTCTLDAPLDSRMQRHTCYPPYTPEVEQKTSFFGVDYTTEHSSIMGLVTTYSAGGFSKEFFMDPTKNFELAYSLRSETWLDRGTRCIIVEINTYNDFTHTYTIIKILFETLPSGLVVPSLIVNTVQEYGILYPVNRAILYFGILYYIIIAFFTYNEIQEFRELTFIGYFRKPGNIIDSIFLIVSYIALGYNVWHPIEVNRIKRKIKEDPNSYICLDRLTNGWHFYVLIITAITFLAWSKVLVYLSFHRTLKWFMNSLKESALNIIGFIFVFLITLFALAQLGTILFSEWLVTFNNNFTTMTTIMRLLMADVDYLSMHAVHPTLAVIYFIALILIIFSLSMNLFVAILLSSYSDVKHKTIVRDTIVFKMMMVCLKRYICFWRQGDKKWLKDRVLLVEIIEQPPEDAAGTDDDQRALNLKEHTLIILREQMAQLTERALKVEEEFENIHLAIERVAKLQAKLNLKWQQSLH